MNDQTRFEFFEVFPLGHEELPEQTVFELSDNDQSVPGNHTSPCVVYPLGDGSISREQIIANLRVGLQNVLNCIPLVGGELKDASGRLTVIRRNHEPIQLGVHHLDSDPTFPSYDALAEQAFSADFFSTNATRLRPPNSNLAGVRRDTGCPVAVFQANFIRGGLILTLPLHHVCGDAKSIDHVFSLWAASTKAAYLGKTMPAFEPALDRSYYSASTVPSQEETEDLKTNIRGFSFHPITQEQSGPLTDPPAPPEINIKMYHFSAASCAQLKQECKFRDETTFVSSYDCISALTWRCMTRARIPYLKMDSQKTTTNYGHPIDVRGRFGGVVPRNYFGNGFLMTATESFTVGALTEQGGLAKAAQAIRQSILEANAESIPNLVNVRKGIEGREEMRWIWKPENVVGTSWTGMEAFQKYDFGFGLPVSIRLPVPPFEGVSGILPANRVPGENGGFDEYVVMEKGCQDRLSQDAEFMKYCVVRG